MPDEQRADTIAKRERSAGPGRGEGAKQPRTAFEDPLSSLPETAQRLLLAAKQIIVSEGFDTLSLNAVAAASGENKAMVAYYFGNKAGLICAVLDSVIHDEYIASKDRMKDVHVDERAQRLVGEMRRMDAAAEEFQVFFELLPRVMRNEALRRRMALLYRWYWGAKLEWLGIEGGDEALDDPDLLGLAQLLSAVIDGLAIQAAIDPEVELANPYRVLTALLKDALPRLGDGRVAGTQGAR